MTTDAEFFDDIPPSGAMPPPKVPDFDPDGSLESTGAEARSDAAGLGMCLFVVIDGVLFGGLFGLYGTLHAAHPEIFSHGRYFLNAVTGVVANSVLLLSCLTAALAVRFARRGTARTLTLSIAATIVLAGFFLGIQGAEYSDKVERGLLPGSHYMATEPVWETATFQREHPRAAEFARRFRPGDPTHVGEPGATASVVLPLVRAGALGDRAMFPNLPSEPRNAHLFFGTYFLFSGLVAFHVLCGAVVWVWFLARARRVVVEPGRLAAVDYAALYWNFITVVRVLMFPLFYLVR